MKLLINILVFAIFISTTIFAEGVKLSGRVEDSSTGEGLMNVFIGIQKGQYYTHTDKEGNFSVNIPAAGEWSYIVSLTGYEPVRGIVDIGSDGIENFIIKLVKTDIRMGEVVVKSLYQNKMERDAAMPLEIIEKDNGEQGNMSSIASFMDNKPGISMARDGIWATHVNIRGLSRQNIVANIDGARIETSTAVAAGLSALDPGDIERIEVVKGSASSLYGSGAVGGVINIVTNSPGFTQTPNFSGSFSSGYYSVNSGSYNNLALNFSGGDHYVNIKSGYRVAKDAETPDGKLLNSRFRDHSINVNGGLRFAEKHTIKFVYQNFKAEDVGVPGGNPFPVAASVRYPETGRRMYNVSWEVSRPFSFMNSLKATVYHQEYERQVEVKPNSALTIRPNADHRTIGGKLETHFTWKDNHIIVAGLDYWKREYDGIRSKTFTTPDKVIYDYPVPHSWFSSAGLFIQDDIYLLDERLVVTLGGRYDLINITNEAATNPTRIVVNGVVNNNPPIIEQASFPEADVDNRSWSYNVGIMYKLSKSSELTFNGASSFRAPSLEERYQYLDLGGDIYLGNPDLEPEKGIFFDLGYRAWRDDMSLKLNIFTNYFNDLVANVVEIPDSLFIKRNISEAKIYGFETAFEVSLVKNFFVFGNVSYVRGIETKYNLDLAEIPPVNGIFGVRGKFPYEIDVNLNCEFAGEQNAVASYENTTEGYAIINFAAARRNISSGKISFNLSAGIRNALDEKYRLHLSSNRGLIKLEPGRNLFVRVKVNW